MVIRRDTSYRTQDEFPVVYHWYSTGFSLGPEKAAQSSCIYMEESFNELFLIERHMAVYLCDADSGRMIFVERTLSIRYR